MGGPPGPTCSPIQDRGAGRDDVPNPDAGIHSRVEDHERRFVPTSVGSGNTQAVIPGGSAPVTDNSRGGRIEADFQPTFVDTESPDLKGSFKEVFCLWLHRTLKGVPPAGGDAEETKGATAKKTARTTTITLKESTT